MSLIVWSAVFESLLQINTQSSAIDQQTSGILKSSHCAEAFYLVDVFLENLFKANSFYQDLEDLIILSVYEWAIINMYVESIEHIIFIVWI